MRLRRLLSGMIARLRALVRPRLVTREIEEELDFHMVMERRKLAAIGMTAPAAAAEARRRFGNLDRVRAACRTVIFGRSELGAPHPAKSPRRSRDIMENLVQDVRQALRLLLKQPGFTAIAVLSLGIGIGANTTIFSFMNALLLRPLPVADADRMIEVGAAFNGSGFHSVAYQDYRRLRERAATLEGLAGASNRQFAVSVDGAARMATGAIVTGNYFDVMGIDPVAGRFFVPEEDRTPNTHPAAVISQRLWQWEFGSNPAAVGAEIVVNNHPFVIVGVAPASFTGTAVIVQEDVWIPIMMIGQVMPRFSNIVQGRGPSLIVIGKLADGTGAEQAGAELAAIGARLAEEFPTTNETIGIRTAPARAIPGEIRGPVGGFMGLLLALTGLVLAIACINLANMLLARSIARGRDFAVRLAMGAGRARLVRQLLTETLALYAIGAAVGLAVSIWATRAWTALLPALKALEGSERAGLNLNLDLGIDWRVMAFALATTLGTGIVFGTLPALRASRPDLVPMLKDGTVSGGHTKSRLRSIFVITQVAVSLVLLVGAGLFLRTIQQARMMDPGFDANNVTVALLRLRSAGLRDSAAVAFYRALSERLEAARGAELEAFSFASDLPLDLGNSQTGFNVPGHEPPPGRRGFSAESNVVSPGYFDALRIPLLRGRDFAPRDDRTSPPVAIVNSELARRFWPDRDPIGQFIQQGRPPNVTEIEVVGVVQTIKYRSLGEAARMALYHPWAQNEPSSANVVLRSSLAGGDALALLGREVENVNPDMPMGWGTTLRELNATALFPQMAAASVTGVLGVVALLLVTLGIYGVVSYTATQRIREMGIRVALGATGGGIVGLVLRQGVRLCLIGIAFGVVIALLVTRFMSGLLVGVSPTDPLTIIAISALLSSVALVASYVPALRASKVDPMVALRYE